MPVDCCLRLLCSLKMPSAYAPAQLLSAMETSGPSSFSYLHSPKPDAGCFACCRGSALHQWLMCMALKHHQLHSRVLFQNGLLPRVTSDSSSLLFRVIGRRRKKMKQRKKIKERQLEGHEWCYSDTRFRVVFSDQNRRAHS